MEKETILGFDVCTANKQNLLENLFKDYKAGIQRFIVNINPEIVTSNYKNEDYKKALNSEKYQIPDGSGIVWASKRNKGHIKKRITGIDLMLDICNEAQKYQAKIYLYGSKKEIVQKAKENLEKEYTKLQVIGTCDGYINEEWAVKDIKETGADIVFVGLGSPKQEKFIINNKEKLKDVKIKVMTVFGTRPEAIKMAPLVKELKSREEIECIVCVTAQHRQMLDQVLEVFDIKPDYDLNIMQVGQTLSDITSRALTGLEKVIKEVKPNIVLVHGDTTTTFAGALAAYYNQVDIGHVEAGLRTWNKYSPFPEEMNRQMVGVMADMHFAPTENSKNSLLKENKNPETIYVTGNTAIDALATTVKKDYYNPVFDWVGNDRLVLLTAHRRENLGEPMRHMFKAIKRIVEEIDDVKVIYPVHLNPKVREVADEILGDNEKIKLIEPLEVIDFHNFINKSYLILTDSGGIQEEAPGLGKPVLVLRDTTERPEGIEAGTLKLAGTNEETIYKLTKELLTDKSVYESMSKATNPYGDGKASKRITDSIIDKYRGILGD